MSYGASSVLAGQFSPQCSAPSATEVREGTLQAEIRDLHAQLQSLDDVTGKLRQRLSPLVLDRPTVGQVGCDTPRSPVVRCEVAGAVHAAVDLACNITAKVNDMLCCLEL